MNRSAVIPGLLVAVGALCWLAFVEPSSAHPRATSLSAWELVEGAGGHEARVTVRVPWSALQRTLPELSGLAPEGLGYRADGRTAVDGYLLDHVRLRAGSQPCSVRGPLLPVSSADPAHLARRFRLACGSGELTISVDLFQEVDASHLHLARARLPEGRELDRVLVLGDSEWQLGGAGAADEAARDSSIGDYLRLGLEHIATGYDHLVFVLALLLTGTGLRQLATVVTGFTVAHSLTLAVGVLGWATPLPAAVEALIGFSIVVVACENFAITLGARMRRALVAAPALLIAGGVAGAMFGHVALPMAALAGIGLFSFCYLALAGRSARPENLRWAVALAFGLVHGFGFAGVLSETGLPPENVAPALLGFNLGVELGQLAVVALGWSCLRPWLLGPTPRRFATIQWGTTPVLAAGLYWFVSRALAG